MVGLLGSQTWVGEGVIQAVNTFPERPHTFQSRGRLLVGLYGAGSIIWSIGCGTYTRVERCAL